MILDLIAQASGDDLAVWLLAAGAVVLTIGIFLPAFAFTLLAHEPLALIRACVE